MNEQDASEFETMMAGEISAIKQLLAGGTLRGCRMGMAGLSKIELQDMLASREKLVSDHRTRMKYFRQFKFGDASKRYRDFAYSWLWGNRDYRPEAASPDRLKLYINYHGVSALHYHLDSVLRGYYLPCVHVSDSGEFAYQVLGTSQDIDGINIVYCDEHGEFCMESLPPPYALYQALPVRRLADLVS